MSWFQRLGEAAFPTAHREMAAKGIEHAPMLALLTSIYNSPDAIPGRLMNYLSGMGLRKGVGHIMGSSQGRVGGKPGGIKPPKMGFAKRSYRKRVFKGKAYPKKRVVKRRVVKKRSYGKRSYGKSAAAILMKSLTNRML